MSQFVSILIPAYNAEKWIAQTIRSCLEQTWPHKEIIIVDDGSTDGTLSVARQFASKDVCVLTHANQGAAATRNKAYSMCQGTYIQWLDADDLLASEKVARQMDAVNRDPNPRALLSASWAQFIRRVGKAQFEPTALWCDLSPIEWMLRKLDQNLHMQTATWLVSRQLTEAAGPWDARLLSDDDGEYFSRVILASEGIRFVPNAKVLYRSVSSGRLSNIGMSDKKKDAMLLSMKLNVDYIRSLEDSERVRKACLKYLNAWLINFYPERPECVEELRKLAGDLGGQLETPRLSWKFQWIKTFLGWGLAKRAQIAVPAFKHSLIRLWDRALAQLGEPTER
jgi:glycosyltransferase involved in cell wall biosynthesis